MSEAENPSRGEPTDLYARRYGSFRGEYIANLRRVHSVLWGTDFDETLAQAGFGDASLAGLGGWETTMLDPDDTPTPFTKELRQHMTAATAIYESTGHTHSERIAALQRLARYCSELEGRLRQAAGDNHE